MADKKISELDSVSIFSDNDNYIPIAQTDATRKTTILTFANYVLGKLGGVLWALTTKTTPVDADTITINDTEDSNSLKKVSFTNVKSFLKTYFDTIYTTQAWVNAQGFITNVVTALGYTPEDSANKSSSYTASSTTTYANTKALVDGLASILTMIGKEFSMTMPGSTAFNGLGNYIFNVAGTADNIAPDFSSSNKFLQTIRRRYTSAGTAGSSVQFGDTSFRKLAIGYNYTSIFIFGNEDASTVANARCFHGYSSTTTIGNINPSTLTNCFGVGADTGDTNLQIIHNDTTGTATKIDLGSSFPANTISDDFYFIRFDLQTNGNVIVYVKNLKTGAESTNTITTDLPVSTLGLFANSWRNNGTTASAVRLSLIHWANVRNSY